MLRVFEGFYTDGRMLVPVYFKGKKYTAIIGTSYPSLMVSEKLIRENFLIKHTDGYYYLPEISLCKPLDTFIQNNLKTQKISENSPLLSLGVDMILGISVFVGSELHMSNSSFTFHYCVKWNCDDMNSLSDVSRYTEGEN